MLYSSLRDTHEFRWEILSDLQLTDVMLLKLGVLICSYDEVLFQSSFEHNVSYIWNYFNLYVLVRSPQLIAFVVT